MIHKPWADLPLFTALMADSELPQHHVAHKPRSGGLHMSTLYHALHPQKKNDFAEADLQLFRVGGLALEDRANRALSEMAVQTGRRIERPDEIVSAEGVAGSPDVLFYEDELVVGEIKMTWKSANGLVTDREGENEFPEKFAIYFTQVMAYAHVLDTQYGRLIAYFPKGDYKSMAPKLLAWDLWFSIQEREETWDALMQLASEYRE